MSPRWTTLAAVAAPLLILAAVHLAVHRAGEPYYTSDETRHVMTGVFVRDAVLDSAAWTGPRGFAVRYYLQYPALGLLVWPPFFYVVEGVWMLVFGTSFLAAKSLVALFVGLACVYLFRLVRMTHNVTHAALTVLLFGLTPVVFTFSRQVMLEMPTVAVSLVSIFYFERYLREERRRDAWLACVCAALAALTRYDGIFLMAFFFARLIMARRPDLLLRRHVLGGVALALLLVGPVFAITYKEYGGAISKAVNQGTRADFKPFSIRENLPFYPKAVPDQVGWLTTRAVVAGLVAVCFPGGFRRNGPYLGLLIGVYVTFTPMAELEPRHAIYWVPALALLAVEGVALAFKLVRLPKALPVGIVVLAVATAWPSVSRPMNYVRGYETAAKFVVDHTQESPVCLFDGDLNGTFIYEVRRHDPQRRLTVLRGDKIIYGVFSDPHAAYQEWAKTDAELLAIIDRFDPEWIIVEDPPVKFDNLAAAARLRAVLRADPERFRRERVVRLDTNHSDVARSVLVLYRNTKRNPNREPLRSLEMLNIRRKLTAE